MKPKRLLVFIVSYNASKTIEGVLNRLPAALFTDPRYRAEVLIIDDCSADNTFRVGYDYAKLDCKFPLTVLKNRKNLGYGGNQKVGYHYAIERGFDIVALLHGDGQYAPELLPELLEPLLKEEADAVFGSRMIEKGSARKGGMPLYKYFANKFLTTLENRLVGTTLSEYHSGYRLYSCSALAKLPFYCNSNKFDFDTDIILQCAGAGLRIKEVPIPTYYGEEKCHVNGVAYAFDILGSCLRYGFQRFGLFYHPKFELGQRKRYEAKLGYSSSHSRALQALKEDDKVLVLGSSLPDEVQSELQRRVKHLCFCSPDLLLGISEGSGEGSNYPQLCGLDSFDVVLVPDVIQHLDVPEDILRFLRSDPRTMESRLIVTTGNIGFLPLRLMLLIGYFNYSNRGILDVANKRLFTFWSLKSLLNHESYRVKVLKGIPAPYPLALGDGRLARFLLAINEFAIRLWKSGFSYQIYCEAQPLPTVQTLLNDAFVNSAAEAASIRR